MDDKEPQSVLTLPFLVLILHLPLFHSWLRSLEIHGFVANSGNLTGTLTRAEPEEECAPAQGWWRVVVFSPVFWSDVVTSL